MKQTQPQRILAALQALQTDEHNISEEYIRHNPSGDGPRI
jgi:hypothetical protein